MTAKIGAVALALAFAALALGLKYSLRHQMISEETSTRSFQAALGFLIAFYGNMMPKNAPVCGEEGSWSRRKQSLLRVGGWLFVIAGLGYAAIWLAVPISIASDTSMVLVATATTIVLVYTLWVVFTSPRKSGGRPA